MWTLIVCVLAAYLIGAIPTGYIIAKRLKGIDIREHGSGNVGATNVKRVVGNKAGLATLALDFLKGFVPVLVACWLYPASRHPLQILPVLMALALVVGHSRSVYIGFKGGKSVITSLGALLALEPMIALVSAGVGILIMKTTRYVSLGSMIGAALVALLTYGLHHPVSHQILTGFVAVYVIYLHRSNIVRLLSHQENKI